MGRKVKCQVTGEQGTSDVFVRINGKYYKNQEVYDAWHKNNEARKKVIDIIACEYLDYKPGQTFPTILTRKLKDFDFYGYEVVLSTLEKCHKSIEYSMQKEFDNDTAKIAYIMAIIKNNINEVYRECQRKEKIKEKLGEEPVRFEVNNEQSIMNIGSKVKAKDISDFLED